MNDIGKLEPVELRELWKHEERGFSAWLERNLDVLGEVLDLSLVNPERETSAGDFACDLLVEGEQGERIIIENQLEQTDHGHLGKLITYLVNLDAKGAIWIASYPRLEHVRAIQWLNETSPDDTAFYLVQLSAYRIGGSVPAPLFTLIAGPSQESKEFGKQKKELAERHVLRLEFWTALLERAKKKGVATHAQRAPSRDHWLGAGAGVRSGVSYNYLIFTGGGAAVELYLATTEKSTNKRIFDQLLADRAEIERLIGESLAWERLDEKRASRIRCNVTDKGLEAPKEQWAAIQEEMIDAMDRMAKAFKPALTRASATAPVTVHGAV